MFPHHLFRQNHLRYHNKNPRDHHNYVHYTNQNYDLNLRANKGFECDECEEPDDERVEFAK